MMKQIILGLGLVLVAFGAVSAFAIWMDGKKFVGTQKASHRASASRNNPSFLDPEKFHWTPEATLRQYAREHHVQIIQAIKSEKRP